MAKYCKSILEEFQLQEHLHVNLQFFSFCIRLKSMAQCHGNCVISLVLQTAVVVYSYTVRFRVLMEEEFLTRRLKIVCEKLSFVSNQIMVVFVRKKNTIKLKPLTKRKPLYSLNQKLNNSCNVIDKAERNWGSAESTKNKRCNHR